MAILINFSLVAYMLMGLYGFKIPLLAGIIPPEIHSKGIVQHKNYNNLLTIQCQENEKEAINVS